MGRGAGNRLKLRRLLQCDLDNTGSYSVFLTKLSLRLVATEILETAC